MHLHWHLCGLPKELNKTSLKIATELEVVGMAEESEKEMNCQSEEQHRVLLLVTFIHSCRTAKVVGFLKFENS